MNSKEREAELFRSISVHYIVLYLIQFSLLAFLVVIFGEFFYFWPTELFIFVMSFYQAYDQWEQERKDIS